MLSTEQITPVIFMNGATAHVLRHFDVGNVLASPAAPAA
jgi:hypothetical protein